jgi:hypothetical protein
MSCAISEVQEGTELNPAWSFAKSKEIQGDYTTWGCDLRSAMKAHVEFGALEQELSDWSVDTKDTDTLRNIANWQYYPTLRHRKKTYFKVSGRYDHFDNIKATLVKFNTPIGIGVQFGWKTSDVLLDTIGKGYGHAMTVVGYKGDTLAVLNSYGTSAGADGIHYMTRNVVNHFVNIYGAYTFTDMDKDDAKYNADRGIIDTDNWLIQLWKAIKYLFA